MRSKKLPDLCPHCWKLFQMLGMKKITNQLSTPFTSPRAACGAAICAKKDDRLSTLSLHHQIGVK